MLSVRVKLSGVDDIYDLQLAATRLLTDALVRRMCIDGRCVLEDLFGESIGDTQMCESIPDYFDLLMSDI